MSHSSGLGHLEEEMMDFDPLTGLSAGRSPNRVDAVVHGITELYEPDFVPFAL
jgi:phage terminase large subunit-like protein